MDWRLVDFEGEERLKIGKSPKCDRAGKEEGQSLGGHCVPLLPDRWQGSQDAVDNG